MMKLGRRSFLTQGLIGGALLVVGGSTGLALRRTRLRYKPSKPLKFLTEEEFNIFSAVADRIIPGSDNHPSASELQVGEKADAVMARGEPVARGEFKQLLGLFDNALASLLFDFRITPFTQLEPEAQDEAIERWQGSRIVLRRTGYQALKRLTCACYYASPESWPSIGYEAQYELAKQVDTAQAVTP